MGTLPDPNAETGLTAKPPSYDALAESRAKSLAYALDRIYADRRDDRMEREKADQQALESHDRELFRGER